MAESAKLASRTMAMANTEMKNHALELLRQNLQSSHQAILIANSEDIAEAKAQGLSPSMLDRLSLQGRLEGIIADIAQVIRLPDPIGEVCERPGLVGELDVIKCRTPLGVLGVIYESRPNVTIDVSALSLKSGNCAILRGGSETLRTNQVLVMAIQDSLRAAGLPPQAIQLVQTKDRAQVRKLLRLHAYIDLIIPRGGAALHRYCRENSTIPVITGGIGICHLFADETASVEPSIEVIVNAKTQRPTVCNALDTLLVHRGIAASFIPQVVDALRAKGVVFKLDNAAWEIMQKQHAANCQLAQPGDWNQEWLSLVLGVKVVADVGEAIAHIAAFSTAHSDGILTETAANAARFVKEVDSAAVYVNASTRFTDGSQLGLGAEVAISTQKLHARGPMGLKELTSYKWVIRGDYAIRP